MLEPRPLHAVLLTVAVATAVVLPSTPSWALAGASIVVSSARGLPSDSGAQEADEDDADDAADDDAGDPSNDPSDDLADADDDDGDDVSDDASAAPAADSRSEIDQAKKASSSAANRAGGRSADRASGAASSAPAPTRVRAVSTGRTSVRLRWHAATGRAPRGFVARIRHGAATRELRVGPSVRAASFRGLVAGTRYSASVIAVGGSTSAVQHVRTARVKASKRAHRLATAAAARAGRLAQQLRQAAAAR